MALVLKQKSTSDSFAQLRQKAEFTVARFKAAPENLNFDSSGQELIRGVRYMSIR